MGLQPLDRISTFSYPDLSPTAIGKWGYQFAGENINRVLQIISDNKQLKTIGPFAVYALAITTIGSILYKPASNLQEKKLFVLSLLGSAAFYGLCVALLPKIALNNYTLCIITTASILAYVTNVLYTANINKLLKSCDAIEQKLKSCDAIEQKLINIAEQAKELQNQLAIQTKMAQDVGLEKSELEKTTQTLQESIKKLEKELQSLQYEKNKISNELKTAQATIKLLEAANLRKNKRKSSTPQRSISPPRVGINSEVDRVLTQVNRKLDSTG